MLNNKLVFLLKTFTVRELKQFEKYVNSSFFNENETLCRLLALIYRAAPEFRQAPLSKQEAWSVMELKGAYNDLKYRRYISDLVRLCEGFMSYKVYQKHEIRARQNLLISLNERSVDKYFENYLKQARRSLAQQPLRDAGFYYDQFILDHEYNHYVEMKFERTKETQIEQALQNIDIFYLVHKLSGWCAILNFQKVTGRSHEIFLMEEILEHLKKKSYDHVPAIAIYYQILMTFTEEGGEPAFEKLVRLLKEHSHQFRHSEARKMYIYAQNYCLRKINSGATEYLEALFDLYKNALEKQVLLENNVLSPWSFKNIVTTALRLQQFDWVDEFIRTWYRKLAPAFRDNAYNYNRANLFFYRKEYPKVLVQLQRVELNDIFYSLDGRAMLLKTYYELGEVEALLALTESFRLFLRRNRHISDIHKTNYLNLIRYVRRLIKLDKHDRLKISRLEQAVNQTKKVADLGWLNEKINAKTTGSLA